MFKRIIAKLGMQKFIIVCAATGVAVTGGVTAGVILSQNNDSQSPKTEIKDEKKEYAESIGSSIILRDVVIVKGQELSKDPMFYIYELPEGVDIDEFEMELDISNVDTNNVGQYGYSIKYFEISNNATVYVVETIEEQEKLVEKIEKERKNIISIAPDSKEEDKNQEVTEEPKKENTSSKNKTDNKKPSTNNSGSSNQSSSSNKPNNTPTTKPSNTPKPSNPPVVEDNNEEEVVKELSATAKGTSTDYNIVKAELSISNAHTPFSLEDYNGELMYKFTKIVELDVYSESASFNFFTKTNLNARTHEQAIKKAKELYGDSGCVVAVENGYAMNKNGGYVGVIGKMIIGQLNEYNWCENNVKSIYINNRTPLTQNDDKYIFE